MRASCEYQTSSGLTAASPAATRPTRIADGAGADRVDDRHERGPAERRQRAQADLAGAEHLRPQPRDDVVERRRGLALRDPVEHVAEIHPDEPDRYRLVVPEALLVEGREAQERRERDDAPE